MTSSLTALLTNVQSVILGKTEQTELLVAALLARGHVLIEDVPGTGKTMLARALAASLGLRFKRLQCTPDLLPTDVVGVNVFNAQAGTFEFRPGPVFVNLLLADEINRATPRAQAALLEAMQEQQVTVDGATHPLEQPFMVLATQNPVEFEGTFPLPEAQLDRFMVRLALGYPAEAEELGILRGIGRQATHPVETLPTVMTATEVHALMGQVSAVHVDETLERYILALVQATRQHPDVALGASPRGSLALLRLGQALALVHGRNHVLPDDLKRLAPLTLAHRLVLTPESQLRGRTAHTILRDIVAQTPLSLGA